MAYVVKGRILLDVVRAAISLISGGFQRVCSIMEYRLPIVNHLQPANLHCSRKARMLMVKKEIGCHVQLKLRHKNMQPQFTHSQRIYSKLAMTSLTVPMSTTDVASSYQQLYSYQQDQNYQITMNDWSPLHVPVVSAHPVPVIVPPLNPLCTSLAPLVGSVVQPIVSPLLPPNYLQGNVTNVSGYINEYSNFTEGTEISNEIQYYEQDETSSAETTTYLENANTEAKVRRDDSVESYLRLPKELFPTAKMLALDPNPIIDELCKIPNVLRHIPWLLDLEFGIPKTPITRLIPIYDVKLNSIHCKNAPDAIHPGFESCDPEFKKVLLFYYDSIVSAWYKGYMIMHYDRSVENFQSWLLQPMEALGMCWP